MSGLVSLTKKEIKEQLRTHKYLVAGSIFLFFGLTTPLLLKYLPQIIQLAGEQIPVELPPPTAVQSLTEYAGTIGQIGILVAVLIAMGSIANELRNGTAVMVLSKPVSRAAFVNAKLIAMSATFLAAIILAALFCFAYTYWLIGRADALPFVGLNFLLWTFVIFCLAVTTLFSSIFRSAPAAGGLAIAVIIAQALLASAPVIGNYLPGKLLGWGTALVNGNAQSYWWALAVTVLAIGVCLYLAQRILKEKEI